VIPIKENAKKDHMKKYYHGRRHKPWHFLNSFAPCHLMFCMFGCAFLDLNKFKSNNAHSTYIPLNVL
jgi:hypothetical protein